MAHLELFQKELMIQKGTQQAEMPLKRAIHLARSSWLMLLAHEEGSRYIPQLGDEVAYLRQSRYDASIERNWTTRDKCHVWWKNEGDEAGSWWEGRIVGVKTKSPDFPDSPWERYSVSAYDQAPKEDHQHSP
ncbi:hypothetical protein Leryth_017315 [Lithospermum erythrorhizon]|nr:hypothetical protein Leryth_017315 [Lithospermum erythrorhizon]